MKHTFINEIHRIHLWSYDAMQCNVKQELNIGKNVIRLLLYHQVGTLFHWCFDDRCTTPPEGSSETSGIPGAPTLCLHPFYLIFFGGQLLSFLLIQSLRCSFSSSGEDFDGLPLGLPSNSQVLHESGSWFAYEVVSNFNWANFGYLAVLFYVSCQLSILKFLVFIGLLQGLPRHSKLWFKLCAGPKHKVWPRVGCGNLI